MKLIDVNKILTAEQKKKARQEVSKYLGGHSPGYVNRQSVHIIPSKADETRIHLYYTSVTGKQYHEIFIWSVGDVWALV